MTRAFWPVLGALVLAGAGAAFADEAEHPDLSGVWTLDSRPMTSAQGYPELDLTEAGRAAVDAYRALVDPRGESPTLFCVSHGMPEMMMGGGAYPIELIQQPDQITIVSEWASETRRIYLGEAVAPDGDIFPSRHGYSVGRWEGEVLVVETAHLQEMADSRYPHSAAATITERFQLEETEDGAPRLIADTVVRDPDWLAEPLEYRLEWRPSETGWILPYECMEQSWLDHLDDLAEESEAAADQ